jgi:hypothetical protein
MPWYQGCKPVKIADLAGVQVGVVEYMLVKDMPRAESCSKFGVRALVTVSHRIWSAICRRIIGRDKDGEESQRRTKSGDEPRTRYWDAKPRNDVMSRLCRMQQAGECSLTSFYEDPPFEFPAPVQCDTLLCIYAEISNKGPNHKKKQVEVITIIISLKTADG